MINESKMHKRLRRLLRDHGYEVQGNTLIMLGIRPLTSDQIIRRVSSLFDACEQLIPVIREDAFRNEFRTICNRGNESASEAVLKELKERYK